MSKVSYYTAEGLKNLRDELNQLKDIERPKASQAIAEARDKGDLSESLDLDRQKIKQIFLNLLSNACKFTKEGVITFGLTNTQDYLYFYVISFTIIVNISRHSTNFFSCNKF